MEQRKWYLPSEVEKHNKYEDCWIILNGKVLDMSNYLNDSHITCNKHSVNSVNKYCPCSSSHKNIRFIVEYAGKDLSEWFRHNGKIIKSFVHPLTYTLCSYTPSIKMQDKNDQPKAVPLWRPIRSIPWWEDAKLVIGSLTSKPRFIRLSNALTKTNMKMGVCEEETLDEIFRFRCHPWNKEFLDYAWGYDGRKLHVDKTLSENGVIWEETKRDRFEEMPEIVPHLTLYPNEEVTDGDCATDVNY